MGEVITLQAGSKDAFATPADPASPSSALVDVFAVLQGSRLGEARAIDFDVFLRNRGVVHAFTDLPSNIVAGTLEVCVRATGESSPHNDSVNLLFIEEDTPGWNDGFLWAGWSGTLKENPGLGTQIPVARETSHQRTDQETTLPPSADCLKREAVAIGPPSIGWRISGN